MPRRSSSAIQDFRKHQGRFLLSEADVLVKPLVRYLKEIPGVEKLEVAGAIGVGRKRWGTSTFWFFAKRARKRSWRFQNYPGAVRVEAAGETKGRIFFGPAFRWTSGSFPGNPLGRPSTTSPGSKNTTWPFGPWG